ncbi:MAG: TetR/AcrR family transcriptional regulator [Terracidiphilus sp.]
MPVKKAKVLRKAKGEYHHGHLKASLKEAALRLVRDRGPRGFSLNEASRLAGVSVAAPYRHFDDKDALLAEIARDGYELLEREIHSAVEKADNLRDRLVDSGMAYLRFARNHTDYFNVMFHSGLDRSKYPEIDRSAKAGLGVVLGLAQQYERTQELAELRTVSAWALVHGLATLDHDGALRATAGMSRSLEQFRPILERFVDRPYI